MPFKRNDSPPLTEGEQLEDWQPQPHKLDLVANLVANVFRQGLAGVHRPQFQADQPWTIEQWRENALTVLGTPEAVAELEARLRGGDA